MGTIIGRTRKDGTTAYLAQILLKRKGQIVHREVQTFDRKQAAKAWLARRETELSDPGAFDRKNDVKLADVIDRYVRESEREMGRTKAQVLAKIKEYEIADLRCSEIKSQHLVEFARSLKVQPQTRANYQVTFRRSSVSLDRLGLSARSSANPRCHGGDAKAWHYR